VKLPGWRKRASRRETWRPVLEAEVKRWSALPWEHLLSKLGGNEAYQLDFEGKHYNVEVTILENTKEYVHVLIDVDDGSLPTSFRPLSESFIRRKEPALAGG
jgi:hypothetical protein